MLQFWRVSALATSFDDGGTLLGFEYALQFGIQHGLRQGDVVA